MCFEENFVKVFNKKNGKFLVFVFTDAFTKFYYHTPKPFLRKSFIDYDRNLNIIDSGSQNCSYILGSYTAWLAINK